MADLPTNERLYLWGGTCFSNSRNLSFNLDLS